MTAESDQTFIPTGSFSFILIPLNSGRLVKEKTRRLISQGAQRPLTPMMQGQIEECIGVIGGHPFYHLLSMFTFSVHTSQISQ